MKAQVTALQQQLAERAPVSADSTEAADLRAQLQAARAAAAEGSSSTEEHLQNGHEASSPAAIGAMSGHEVTSLRERVSELEGQLVKAEAERERAKTQLSR